MENSYLVKLPPLLKKIKPIDIKPTGAKASYKKDKDIKAVIFDIYGTLIISASGDIMQSHYDAGMFEHALKWSGFEINVEVKELINIHSIFENEVNSGKKNARLNGIPFPELDIVDIWIRTLSKAEKAGWITSTNSSDYKLFTFVFELNSNQVWPMPGLKQTLEEIRSKGYPMGIVSNAQFYTPVMMNFFLYDQVKGDEFIDGFEKDISVFSYKILKGKPDTAVYRELLDPLKKRGILPGEVLFVGNDMLKDIYAAVKVGFKTCFFAGDLRAYRLRENHPEASKVKPDHIITELSQLNQIL